MVDYRDISNVPKKDTPFCTLPWIHLATHPIGTVTPCCITEMTNGASTAEDKDGNHLFLSKDSLDKIANSEKFNKLRKDMMEGRYSSLCQKCYKYEKGDTYSKRYESNVKFQHLIDQCFTNTNSDGSLKKVDYKYIELRLGTVCNLKCVTCNPFSSNRWNQDIKSFEGTEFENQYYKLDVKTEWYRDLNFYDELYEKCDELEEIWINGGEPTLIKEHGYFLQKFIDSGRSKDIKLQYSLNCTQFPDSFIDLWDKFKKVKIHLSIDDLEERNYYIRYPSDWNQIITSFYKILKYKHVFDLEVCQTVSPLNVYNIDNFKKFVYDHGLSIAHNYVHYPRHHHVNLIPQEMKESILNNIKYLDKFEIDRLKIELLSEPDKAQQNRFYSFTNILDTTRKVRIYDYLPEWKKYFSII
jgi:hypothetical protein